MVTAPGVAGPHPNGVIHPDRVMPPHPRAGAAGAPLGDPAAAIALAGGFRLASEFISPLDLVALGLVSAVEAEALAATERDAVLREVTGPEGGSEDAWTLPQGRAAYDPARWTADRAPVARRRFQARG
jgi:hypothetical protein